MPSYRTAEQYFHFSAPVLDLEPFRSEQSAEVSFFPVVPGSFSRSELIYRTEGWVGNAQRPVEIYDTPHGMLLKVAGSDEFFIASHGQTICKRNSHEPLTKLEQEVMLGPALVLALALRSAWSLHASAAMFAGNVIVFLGESGQGKSTLAAYLSNNAGWRLVADDILPVNIDSKGLNVLPHFPQLKLSMQAQPGPALPGQLPLGKICALVSAEADAMPELGQIPPSLAIQMLLRHTAGTRMFTPEMLGKHLSFCSLAAGQIPVYQLTYPHRKEALPEIKELLESIC